MIKYGVFGGSFDPPHYGHLALAETARVQLSLARVLFVPAGQPPHKQKRVLSAAEDRVGLVQAAIGDNRAFALSRVDLDRPGPHYTVDMLALLKEQCPQVARWHFLMGEDSLHDLPDWYDPHGILQQAYLAVMPRRGKPADLEALYGQFPRLKERLVWLDVPYLNISSTILRERAEKGLPLRYLVTPTVEAYIRERGLYGSLCSIPLPS